MSPPEGKPLVELLEHPTLDSPVMILGLEGWIDAGFAADGAIEHLTRTLDTITVATFDTDALLDYRARRPVMNLVEGVNRELRWAEVELRAATDVTGQDVLLLVGAEPDHLWHAFADSVVALALDFGCRMLVGLGAYPAPLPHTRPSQLAATCTTPQQADRFSFVRGTLDVPAGVQAVIEERAASHGMEALGIWAQVPHYAAAMPYPAASVRLLEGLTEVAGLAFELGPLRTAAESTHHRLDELVSNSAEHGELVRQLENHVDEAASAEAEIPSADELAAEIQRFLRDQGSGGPAGG
jgi:hypothetical protein